MNIKGMIFSDLLHIRAIMLVALILCAILMISILRFIMDIIKQVSFSRGKRDIISGLAKIENCLKKIDVTHTTDDNNILKEQINIAEGKQENVEQKIRTTIDRNIYGKKPNNIGTNGHVFSEDEISKIIKD